MRHLFLLLTNHHNYEIMKDAEKGKGPGILTLWLCVFFCLCLCSFSIRESMKKQQITLPDVFVSSYQYLIRKLEQSHVIPRSYTSTNTTTDASAKIQGKSETSSRSHLKIKMAKCWSILPLLSAIATFVIEWRLLERIRILLLGEY